MTISRNDAVSERGRGQLEMYFQVHIEFSMCVNENPIPNVQPANVNAFREINIKIFILQQFCLPILNVYNQSGKSFSF